MLDEDALGVVAVGERLEAETEAEPVVVGVEPFGREAPAELVNLCDKVGRSLGRCDECGFVLDARGWTMGGELVEHLEVARWATRTGVGWTALSLAKPTRVKQ